MGEIIRNGWEDKEWVENRAKGYDDLKEMVTKDDYLPENVEKISGIPAAQLKQAAEWIGTAESSALLYSMGITQHTCGIDNVKSTANIQMLTGNIGRRGGGVNALRGQNNVQGACDMGALPNVYSGYQSVADPKIKEVFEQAWGVDGLSDKAGLTLTDMMDAGERGDIKALYIMGENPVRSLPQPERIRNALNKPEFLVVQDILATEHSISRCGVARSRIQ